MKRMIYSTYTKIIVVIICLISVLFAIDSGLNYLKEWESFEKIVYYQEDTFKDSAYLNSKLKLGFYELEESVLSNFENEDFDMANHLIQTISSDEVEYTIVLDEKEYSNMVMQPKNHVYFIHLNMDKNGDVKISQNMDLKLPNERLLEKHDIDIYVGLSETFVNETKMLWVKQKDLIEKNFYLIITACVVMVVCCCYLVITTGKDKDGNKKEYIIDKWFVEINMILMMGAFISAILLSSNLINQYLFERISFNILKPTIYIIATLCLFVGLGMMLSLIRVIKNRQFWKRSLLVCLLKLIIKVIVGMGNKIKTLMGNHSMIAGVLMLLGYTCFMAILGHQVYMNVKYLWMGMLLFIVVAWMLIKYMNDFNRIKKQIHEIKNGNLKIGTKSIYFKDLDQLQNDVNELSNGLQSSVEKSIKAERMKTELITNVSHDLKTPLTSIISYTKLLSKVEGLPTEALDYIAIIDKKSERLKILTQDLFDISKVQSGNDENEMEEINVEVLLSQVLAEYENELDHLTICTNIEKDLFILSDGKKMSRVLYNLLSNIKKYALANTRVFILAYQQNNQVVIEMKNISSYPLDFDKEEVLQRFKRGDESRSEEGHGLGLAIVKSFVETTGGSFEIEIDGDLFKAILKYAQIK